MAACQIWDFGTARSSEVEDYTEVRVDVQQFLNVKLNRDKYRTQPESRKPSITPDLISGAEPSERKASLPLSVELVQRQIESLPGSEDVEVVPTSFAFSEAMRLVVGAYAAIFAVGVGRRIPKLSAPVIGTDDVGGILISWRYRDKYVAAKFGSRPGLRSFVYFQEGLDHRVLDLNEQNLADRLGWLKA